MIVDLVAKGKKIVFTADFNEEKHNSIIFFKSLGMDYIETGHTFWTGNKGFYNDQIFTYNLDVKLVTNITPRDIHNKIITDSDHSAIIIKIKANIKRESRFRISVPNSNEKQEEFIGK